MGRDFQKNINLQQESPIYRRRKRTVSRETQLYIQQLCFIFKANGRQEVLPYQCKFRCESQLATLFLIKKYEIIWEEK